MSGKVEGHKGPSGFSFYGRAGQGEWVRSLILATAGAGLVSTVTFLGPFLVIAFTLRFLAVSSRRLHDLGLSGWLQLGPAALASAAVGLFYAFQAYGVVDYRRLLGLDRLNSDIYSTEPTLSELLSLPGRYSPFGEAGLMESIPIAAYWAAALVSLVIYGVMLFLPGTNGSNCYGEADMERRR